MGMEEALKASGYDLIYLAQVQWDKSYSLVQHCRSRNVEGVLLFGFRRQDLNLDDLLRSEIPTIFIDLDLVGRRAGYITSDNAGAIREAMAYLYKLGHRDIGFLPGMADSFVGKTRFDAYRNALTEFGLPYQSDFVTFSSDFTKDDGREAMAKLLKLSKRPTAIVCASDMLAIGAIETARENGISVPEQLSVIGFDDLDIAAHYHPALTTVRQDKRALGKLALEQLVELIRNPDCPPPSVVVPTQLVVRDSCVPPKG